MPRAPSTRSKIAESPVYRRLLDFIFAVGAAWVEVNLASWAPQQRLDLLEGLALRGWYPPGSNVLSPKLLDRLQSGSFRTVDRYMSRLVERDLNEIVRFVGESYPRRGILVKDALRAHRAGDYALAIPVVLAQADGIARTVIGTSTLYTSRTGKRPAATEFARAIDASDPMMGRIAPYIVSSLRPLEIETQLVTWATVPAGAPEGLGTFELLNRHAVAHGLDADYGSRLNSLRAFSLLRHVTWLAEVARAFAPTLELSRSLRDQERSQSN